MDDQLKLPLEPKKPILITDWYKSWKFWSMQLMGIDAAFIASWNGIPEDIKAHFPTGFYSTISIGLLLAGMVSRVVNQK